MSEEITVIKAQDFGLEEKSVANIVAAFQPKIIERTALEKIYGDIITQEVTPDLAIQASNLRKQLKKVRTGIAEIHKTQKEYFLHSGKYVDAWKNKETLPITQMEDKLVEIEMYLEIKEKERLDKLQDERVKQLEQYLPDAAERQLAHMENDVWLAYLSTKKKKYDDEIAAALKEKKDRIAKEKKAKEDRIAQEKENARLKILADAQAKEIADAKKAKEKEDANSAAILKTIQDKAAADKKASDLLLQQSNEKAVAALEKLNAIAAEEEAQRQIELNKDDGGKMDDLIRKLIDLKSEYSFTSTKNKMLYANVSKLLTKILNYMDDNLN